MRTQSAAPGITLTPCLTGPVPSPPPALPPFPADRGDLLVVDDPSQLHLLYAVCETVLVGSSMLTACTGSSLAGPAIARCALLVGPHGGPGLAEDLNAAALVAAEEALAVVRSTGARALCAHLLRCMRLHTRCTSRWREERLKAASARSHVL